MIVASRAQRHFGVRFIAFLFTIVIASAIPPRLELLLGIAPALPLAAIIFLAPFAGGMELLVLAGIGAFLFVPPQLAANVFSFFIVAPFVVRFLGEHIHALRGVAGTSIFICVGLALFHLVSDIRVFALQPFAVFEDVFLSLLFYGIMLWILRGVLDVPRQ